MTKADRERAISCLGDSIEISRRWFFVKPFTDKEYELMYQFLNEIQNELV
jgi:hypothetical protein